MLIIIILCFNVHFLVLKGNGECSNKKGKEKSFSFQSHLFYLFHHLNPNPSLKRQRNEFFYLFTVLDPNRGLFDWAACTFVLEMGTKMKGICKGFNSFFSQMFVVKEREIEIGLPTDVKHVAHIGWDGASGTAPSWMNEFKTGPEFAATSIGNSGSALSPWSSQDFDQNSGLQLTSDKDIASTDLPNIPKPKPRRKKPKQNTSPRSNSSSTSRTARATAKSKAKLVEVEDDAKPENIEVA